MKKSETVFIYNGWHRTGNFEGTTEGVITQQHLMMRTNYSDRALENP